MWELIPPLLNWHFCRLTGLAQRVPTAQKPVLLGLHPRTIWSVYVWALPTRQRWRINLALLIGLVSIAPMFGKYSRIAVAILRSGQ